MRPARSRGRGAEAAFNVIDYAHATTSERRGRNMKAFIAGAVVAVVLAVAAGLVLDSLGLTASATYSTSNVRL